MTFLRAMNLNILATLTLLTPALVGAAAAGDYPEKPITFVVHSGPGSGTDIFARTLASTLEKNKIVDQPMIVENKTGGSGAVASNYVLSQEGNPYVVWMTTAATLVSAQRQTGSEVYKELVPIAKLASDANVIAVRADSPLKSVKDLVDGAMAAPKTIKAGIGAIGGGGHIGVAMIAQATEAEFAIVPLSSGPEATAALLGGHVDFILENPGEMLTLVQAGKLRLLATTTGERLKEFPDVPTIQEEGINFKYEIGRFIFLPKGVPEDVVAYWGEALKKAVETPEYNKFIDDNQATATALYGNDAVASLEEDIQPIIASLKYLGIMK